MIDERVNRKTEVSTFVLKKKFKGFDEKEFAATVEGELLKRVGSEERVRKLKDEELAEVLQEIVAEETKKTAATLPRKKKGKPI